MIPTVFQLEGATIYDALAAIQAGVAGAAVAVSSDGRLEGIVTDGDIRRALLGGSSISDPVRPFVQGDPLRADDTESRSTILDSMRARGVSQVPVVDANDRVVGVHTLREFLGSQERNNWAVILAGGRGTRLGAMTETTPKPMIKVAGRPILERLVNHLVGFGITRVALCVGYRAEVIEEHFADGSRFGCRITYVREDPALPLGTGGPLGQAYELVKGTAAAIIVVNGDLVTDFDAGKLLEHHSQTGSDITIGTYLYAQDIPFGVVETDGEGMVVRIAEKPVRYEVVSAGVYAMEPHVVAAVAPSAPQPITDIISERIDVGGRVTSWLIERDWMDVGRPEDLARARGALH